MADILVAIQQLPPLLPPLRDSKRRVSGLTIKTDMAAMSSFPEYVDPFESSGDTIIMDSHTPANKLVDQLKGDVARHPSPQPTHVSYPVMSKVNGNGHRVLRSATVGYVAPEFKGKAEQMKQGKPAATAS